MKIADHPLFHDAVDILLMTHGFDEKDARVVNTLKVLAREMADIYYIGEYKSDDLHPTLFMPLARYALEVSGLDIRPDRNRRLQSKLLRSL